MPAKRTSTGVALRNRSTATKKSSSSLKTRDASSDGAYSSEGDANDDADDIIDEQQPKRRRTGAAAKEEAIKLHQRLFSRDAAQAAPQSPCRLPARQHSVAYHQPLLLQATAGPKGQESLLKWFDGVSTARSMPWRKQWIDPEAVSDPDVLREKLERRAYEVWISEIMLQQTRVAVVIDYWNRWMEKWPTIQELAAADPEDVLAAWRGLGYYSRATRIHEAAKRVVGHSEFKGLLPQDAKKLEAEVPGVGRYTAGAISSIVFGRPEPMVDGNVLRVLSRQLGLLGNVKTNKAVIDTLWAAADSLVKDVARGTEHDGSTSDDIPKSDRPGRWGQSLMELGSTICTPKPNCAECPITSTCRAYEEGQGLASGQKSPIGDIEDACTLCEPYESVMDADEDGKEQKKDAKPAKPVAKQATLASFSFTRQTNGKSTPKSNGTGPSSSQMETIVNHARRFPVKIVKKAVREEETLVCAIRRDDGSYLIHRRPEKGLLAGLWEFPSRILDANEGTDTKKRKKLALAHISDLLGVDETSLDHHGEAGSVPWLFSHLKLTMHVHAFDLKEDVPATDGKSTQPSRWSDDVHSESMGTGMHKCWTLVKNTKAWV